MSGCKRFGILFDDTVEAHFTAIEDEDDLDSLLLAHNPRFVQLLEEARERVRITGRVSLAAMRKPLDGGDREAGTRECRGEGVK